MGLFLSYGIPSAFRSRPKSSVIAVALIPNSSQIGAAVIELTTSLTAFWTATASVFRDANSRTTDGTNNRMTEALFTAPSARVTWLCAVFLLGYVGIEVAIGGWIVTFMIRIRDGSPFASGMTATGFWLGITVGRVLLGFVTPKIGEKLAIAVGCPYRL